MKTGGSAFPWHLEITGPANLCHDGKVVRQIPAGEVFANVEGGMYLRDYFAAQALPVCLTYWRSLPEASQNIISYEALAYDAADAMLKERERRGL